MINTIYHRSQKPWAFPMPDQKVGIVLRIGMNFAKKIEIIYGDPMGHDTPNGWIYKTTEMQNVANGSLFEMWEGTMYIPKKRFRYAFKITTQSNEVIFFGEAGVLDNIDDVNLPAKGFTYSYWSKVDFLNTPKWFRQTSWYQIFPDRFSKKGVNQDNTEISSENFKNHKMYGGNIQGIIEKLPHIKHLGFSGIYLTPIFEAKSSHRYETKDYYKVDPILGTEEDFKQLIKEAHKLGIKVMLDAVFNHMGYHSKEFQDVIKNKEHSKYKDWFWINDFSNLKQPKDYKKGEFTKIYPYETFAIVPGMPRLNWENHEVRDYLIKAAEKWTKMGVDGWRLDVSFEPPMHFWREFNQRIKVIKSDAIIIGEVWWDSIQYLEQDIWHGIMNYPVRAVILDYLLSKQTLNDQKQFVAKFNDLAYTYTPEQQWGMFNLMSSHDVERIITTLNNDETKFKMAMKLCFMQPGAPSTYYGQEIGLEGKMDPDNRRIYPWNSKSTQYFKFFQELNKEHKLFVDTSNIYSRFIAKLEGDKITLSNSSNKIIIDGTKVIREVKDGKSN